MSIFDPRQPPSSSMLIAQMLGLPPALMQMLSDPAMQSEIIGAMQNMIQGGIAQRRIEAKLNLVLEGLGYDIRELDERLAPVAAVGIAPVLEGNRALGGGGYSATGQPAHYGGGGNAPGSAQIERNPDPARDAAAPPPVPAWR